MLSSMSSVKPRPAATAIAYRPWRPLSWLLVILAAAAVGLPLGGLVSLFWPQGALAPYEYHLWRWEADNLIENILARAGIGPNPGDTAGQGELRTYMSLTSEIRAQTASANPDLAKIDQLTSERATHEHSVERLIEGYIGEAVSSEGLQHHLPLFDSVSFTWPPVDFKLTSPPGVLVRSPRDRIQRLGDTLIESGLTLREVEKIEADTTNNDSVSLLVPISGLAAYPAIVQDDRNYDSLIETASHEWTHHYLAFFPLGEQWGKGGDAETLNETTANIAGREIANIIRKNHPVTFPVGQDGSGPNLPAPTADFNKEMHDLRLQVDALLKQGKVSDAEQAMEDKRQFLAQHGIVIRKLNQAYFAFYGTYGDSAASSNPVGPKIERVWDLTKDVGAFLAVMREVRSAADVDRAIARLEAAQAGG
jgi:hypothetical protein